MEPINGSTGLTKDEKARLDAKAEEGERERLAEIAEELGVSPDVLEIMAIERSDKLLNGGCAVANVHTGVPTAKRGLGGSIQS